MAGRRLRCAEGFTLLELMVTITVLSVLLVIAVPALRDLIRRNAVSSATNALLADIAYARTEAVSRGLDVSICPSSDGTSCIASGIAYEPGWLVYTYAPGKSVPNTAYDDSKKAINFLLRYTPARDSVSVQALNTTIVSFDQQGQTIPAAQRYAFSICFRPKGASGTGKSTSALPGNQLDVNGSGRATTTTLGVLSNCVPS